MRRDEMKMHLGWLLASGLLWLWVLRLSRTTCSSLPGWGNQLIHEIQKTHAGGGADNGQNGPARSPPQSGKERSGAVGASIREAKQVSGDRVRIQLAHALKLNAWFFVDAEHQRVLGGFK